MGETTQIQRPLHKGFGLRVERLGRGIKRKFKPPSEVVACATTANSSIRKEILEPGVGGTTQIRSLPNCSLDIDVGSDLDVFDGDEILSRDTGSVKFGTF